MQRWKITPLIRRHLLRVAAAFLALFVPVFAESPSIHDLVHAAEPPVVPGHPFYDLPTASGSLWFGRPYGLPDVTGFSAAGGLAMGVWNAGISFRGLTISDVYRSYHSTLFVQRSMGRRLHVLWGGRLLAELFAGNDPILSPQAFVCAGWTVNPLLRVFAGGSVDTVSFGAEPFGGLILAAKATGPVVLHLHRIESGIYRVSFGQSVPLAHGVGAFWGIQNQPVRVDLGVGFGVKDLGSLKFQYASHNRLAGSPQAGIFLRGPDRAR